MKSTGVSFVAAYFYALRARYTAAIRSRMHILRNTSRYKRGKSPAGMQSPPFGSGCRPSQLSVAGRRAKGGANGRLTGNMSWETADTGRNQNGLDTLRWDNGSRQ